MLCHAISWQLLRSFEPRTISCTHLAKKIKVFISTEYQLNWCHYYNVIDFQCPQQSRSKILHQLKMKIINQQLYYGIKG